MEKNRIEKFKNSSLNNLSDNMFSFLKDNYGTRVNINRQFDFNDYKDSVMRELVEFCSDFRELDQSNKIEFNKEAYNKKILKEYVDEILENDYMLEYFTIFKIQQFINKVANLLLKTDSANFIKISTKEKYIKYDENTTFNNDMSIEIDVSSLIGFPSPDRVISYLYKEFNLQRLGINEYGPSLLLIDSDLVKENPIYHDELSKILFKAAVNVNEKKQIELDHPFKEDEKIFLCLCDGFVAKKTPRRVLKKERKEDLTEIEL